MGHFRGRAGAVVAAAALAGGSLAIIARATATPAVPTSYTTAGTYTYTVPSGVCGVTIVATGGVGGAGVFGSLTPTPGGKAATITATVAVSPGDSLPVLVAGPGIAESTTGGSAGGFGGGGGGGGPDGGGGSGGGAGGGGA